jgi:hypothetical protein
MQDGYFMNGIVISKEEYSENNIFISSITDFNVYVRWELSKKIIPQIPSYRFTINRRT